MRSRDIQIIRTGKSEQHKTSSCISGSKSDQPEAPISGYGDLLTGVVALIEQARRMSARAVNTVMTAVYWEIRRRIVEIEQDGKKRADYGKLLLERLATDLTVRYGRGFSARNVWQMRAFYRTWPILQTASAESDPGSARPRVPILQTLSAESDIRAIANRFPLPWSAYVRLLAVKNEHARAFYEKEALRDGWSVRQLDRQIESQFYERAALSRNKAAMLQKGALLKPEDVVTPEDEIKDPYVLEFLGLKDEYSESELEEALIRHLERFLLELGGDFAFVGRQKRLEDRQRLTAAGAEDRRGETKDLLTAEHEEGSNTR